jgi:hypothetical protein
MYHINEFDIEPGTWYDKITHKPIVVTELITCEYVNDVHITVADPIVCFRDLEFSKEKCNISSLRLSEFTNKFSKHETIFA